MLEQLTPVVRTIQVGKPQVFGIDGAEEALDQSFVSGIVKSTAHGPIWCDKLNLAGDGQADLVHHGGIDKAVLFYATEHYPAWRAQLGRPDVSYGAFGENLTVTQLTERNVCVGDRYQIGGTLLEISQPRRPCWKLERRLRSPGLLRIVEENVWSGWYARVVQEGYLTAGDPIILLERPYPILTIEYVTRVIQERKHRRLEATELAKCFVLSESIRKDLRNV